MALRVLLVISMLATVAPAAVKRDDYSPSSSVSSSSTSNVGGGSSPVYSPSASGSSAFNAPSSTSQFTAPQAQPYTSTQDHSGSQSHSSSNSGNLYYYYYPVQDKPKDGGFQAAASNQYTSAVSSPGSSDSSSAHIGDQSSSSSGSSPSDLSYSAQDLTYSAQALNPGLSDYTGSAQASANYDQTLSSLASQLSQQYGSYGNQGYGQQAQPTAYNSNGQQAQATQYSAPSYTYDTSAHSGNQEQAGQFSASNPVPNYGVGPQQAAFIPAQAAPMAAFNPAAQAAAAYAQYAQAGQIPFGSYPAASIPQSSFEPAASGYRRYGIGSFLMPMLALAGLSLLIPTVTSLTASGRKKRSTDASGAPVDIAKESALIQYFDRLERYYSMYKTAVEREECMNRIICELGGVVSGSKNKNPIIS